MSFKHSIIIISTFFIALMLAVLPLPPQFLWLRPDWVAMVVIFWVIACPQIIGLELVWLLGLVLDCMTGTVLGVHAFGLVFIAYFTNAAQPKLRVALMWQQLVFVLTVLWVYQVILCVIQGMLTKTTSVSLIWLPALTSAMLWPWLTFILRDYKFSENPLRR